MRKGTLATGDDCNDYEDDDDDDDATMIFDIFADNFSGPDRAIGLMRVSVCVQTIILT